MWLAISLDLKPRVDTNSSSEPGAVATGQTLNSSVRAFGRPTPGANIPGYSSLSIEPVATASGSDTVRIAIQTHSFRTVTERPAPGRVCFYQQGAPASLLIAQQHRLQGTVWGGMLLAEILNTIGALN